jgi:hypothetical protein
MIFTAGDELSEVQHEDIGSWQVLKHAGPCNLWVRSGMQVIQHNILHEKEGCGM